MIAACPGKAQSIRYSASSTEYKVWVIAACSGEDGDIIPEAADLMFHLLILLADAGLSLNDVRAELARREGQSGHDEKAGRPLSFRPE